MSIDQIPIGRFSSVTRLTLKALRLYHEKGLLVPKAYDSITGYRYYAGDQISRAIKIKTLTSIGFGLDEIKGIFEAEEMGDEVTLKVHLDSRLRRAQEEINQLNRVVDLLTGNKYEEMMSMSLTEPKVKEVPPQRVISKREKGTYQVTIPKLIGEIMGVLNAKENKANHVKMVGPLMTIYHDEEYKEEDTDVEVAVPIVGRVTLTDPEMEVKNTRPAKVISLIHKGPYSTIGMAHAKVQEYMTMTGLKPSGPVRENYLNDPNSVLPSEIMTELQVPVKD